ncbi:unnamed protein product [Caenorhabditis bovis]|uniref:MADF domain-containing protein n=1 Tax=Caenorhabditis bovis TaxID=2654633 RepID=A0A8S1EQC3_9PELO|nr:unnamed protein product [Caenorhabditis bovis]
MSWMSAIVMENFLHNLRTVRGCEAPEWDDCTRGILVALIEERPTIWNDRAKLLKDDVLSSFQQISNILSNKDNRFNVWALIEKWCWMVELYTRSTTFDIEWRYRNSLHFLSEFLKIAAKKEGKQSDVGLFRAEMAFFASETDTLAIPDVISKARENGHRRRGRPPKYLEENQNHHDVTYESHEDKDLDDNAFDKFGFNNAMYTFLIDSVREKCELWHYRHPQRNNTELHDQIFDNIASEIQQKFSENMKNSNLCAIDGKTVKLAWAALKDRFHSEEGKPNSSWKFVTNLQFLSMRVMPALLFDQVFLKDKQSAHNSSPSPSGSVNSDSAASTRIASSSPAMFTTANSKTIQSVLDHLVAAQNKQMMATSQPSTSRDDNTAVEGVQMSQATLTELQKILTANATQLVNGNVGPPAKKSRTESPLSNGTATMVVVNDARKNTPATISTWVPPKEDSVTTMANNTVSKSKDEPTPKRSQSGVIPGATAVIRTNASVDKQLRKNNLQLQQTLAAGLNNGRSTILNSVARQNPAISQALFKNKSPPPSSQSTNHIGMNGDHMLMTKDNENDKWGYLGKFVTATAREIEQHDPILACHFLKDLQETVIKYQFQSLAASSLNTTSST